MSTQRLIGWAAGLVGAALLLSCSGSNKARGPEGDSQAREADALMDEAEHLMKAFDVDLAAKDLVKVRELLKDPKVQNHPDLSVLWDRFNGAQGDLEIARKDKAKHELALKVNGQEQNIERARGPLLKAIEDLDKPDLVKAQVEAVVAAVKKLQEAVAAGKSLEAQDTGYAEEAKHALRLVDKASTAQALAEKRLAFIGGALADAEAGLKASNDGKAEKDKAKKEPLLTEAKTKLQSCLDGEAKAVADTPDLAKTSVMLEGKARTVDSVGKTCKTALSSNDKQIALLAKASKKRGKH